MTITKIIKSFFITIKNIINNPNTYVAASVGTLVGLFTGGAVGLFSGGFLGYQSKICNDCIPSVFSITPDIIIGGIIGIVLGGLIGGVISGIITIYKMHNKTLQLPILSPENIRSILFNAFWISAEVSIGMGLGAIIGSLKAPGIGSILGAFMGIMLMLFTSTIEKKPESIINSKA